MKIRSVRSYLMSYPMAEPVRLSYYGGERVIFKRDAAFVKVVTGSGLTGYCPGQPSEKAQKAIEGTIAPFLEGRTLADTDALRAQFIEEASPDLEMRKLYAGVEMALYDLIGRDKGVPVSELLGGRVRDRVRLYGSAGMYQPPEGYAAEAAGMRDLGFSGYKMRPALGPEDDVRTVGLMREAAGPDMDIMVDAHAWWRMGDRSYTPETIERLAGEMAEYRIAWLEEPLPPDNHDDYRRLRERDIVPVASGEHEPSDETFHDLIVGGCVDYVQADVVCQGGYPTGRRVISEAAQEGLRFAFHSWGTALEVMAAAHLGICWPETVVEWLEYPVYTTRRLKTMYPFPLAGEILTEPLEVHAGELTVPRGPGLGVDVDESVVERYPWIPGAWSTFTLISPPGTWSVTSDHSVQWAEGEASH